MVYVPPVLETRGWGPGPNGAESRDGTLYGFMGSFGPLAFIAVSLRSYSRWKFAKIGADDITILTGFILYLGLIVATVYAIKYGLGLHIQDVPYNVTGVNMQKCGFTSQVLYPASLGLIKSSILLFLLRTLPPAHFWKKPLYIFVAWVVTSELAFTIGLFLQCRPLAFYWDKSLEGTCFNQPAFYYVDASLNMATDIGILSLPWLIFRKLNMSKRRKIELITVCSVGVFTLIASAIRLPYLHELNISTDPTWQVVDVCIWSIAELGSAITLSSVPAIRPLISHVFPNTPFTSSSRSGSGGSSNNQPKSQESAGKKSASSFGKQSTNDSSAYVELDEIEEMKHGRGLYTAGSQEAILAGGNLNGITKTVDFRLGSERR